MDLVHRGSFQRHSSVTKDYRLATDDEAAKAAERKRRKDSEKRFNELCDYQGDWAHTPDHSGKLQPEIDAEITERVLIWKKTVGYSLHQAWRTNIGLLSFHPVYDDSPTWKLLRWEVMSPEDIEIIRTAKEIK